MKRDYANMDLNFLLLLKYDKYYQNYCESKEVLN